MRPLLVGIGLAVSAFGIAGAQSHAVPAEIDKVERLSSSGAAPKTARLAGAEIAVLEARRPAPQLARLVIAAALETELARTERERLFAGLAARRPAAETMRAALLPAMENLVVVAPRGGSAFDVALEDDAADDAPAPVQLASLATGSVQIAAVLPAGPQLPQSGPLPLSRPKATEGLAAIAAIAPQKPDPRREARESRALAYARPENPLRGQSDMPASPQPKWPGIGTKVAVYDISAGVVHMPNGEKLEAHSGIGRMRDKPQYANVKMRGPTPPGTYRLTMREKLFHGVAAIRLNPVDGKPPLGRTGLLAHSYLLRKPGDSHGCVAFANYDRFLRAFRRGEITHMVVVPKYDGRRPGGNGNMNLVNFIRGGRS